MEVRKRYAVTLQRERELLAQASERITGPERSLLDDLRGQRDSLARYHAELQAFRARLGHLVDRKAYDIRAQLLREESLLQSHIDAIGDTRRQAKRVVGEVAVGSLVDVASKFRKIVLRGDVGVLDVAWTLKQEQSARMDKRIREQRRDLNELDFEFRDILVEE